MNVLSLLENLAIESLVVQVWYHLFNLLLLFLSNEDLLFLLTLLIFISKGILPKLQLLLLWRVHSCLASSIHQELSCSWSPNVYHQALFLFAINPSHVNDKSLLLLLLFSRSVYAALLRMCLLLLLSRAIIVLHHIWDHDAPAFLQLFQDWDWILFILLKIHALLSCRIRCAYKHLLLVLNFSSFLIELPLEWSLVSWTLNIVKVDNLLLLEVFAFLQLFFGLLMSRLRYHVQRLIHLNWGCRYLRRLANIHYETTTREVLLFLKDRLLWDTTVAIVERVLMSLMTHGCAFIFMEAPTMVVRNFHSWILCLRLEQRLNVNLHTITPD